MSKTKKTQGNITIKDPETGIYFEYFNQTKIYQSQYGKNTIVLMQVGAFFEVYGIKQFDNNITESIIEEFANVCQLNISEKKIAYSGGQIIMAGFRDFTLEKYLSILTDNGYTIPVFVQEKNGKDTIRKLSKVYSSGTYLSCDTDSSPKITNHIMCIWLETFKPISNNSREIIVYGVSVINIFTGKSSMFQHETSFFLNTSTFDELERYVSIFCPSEVILLSPFKEKEIHSIIQMSGIQTQNIHLINTNSIESQNKVEIEKIQRCANQKYLKQIISKFFGEESYDLCSEFQTYNMATQSFCYLLNFIQEHNSYLIKKIAIPEFNNASTRMILANHTLSQLNIIQDNNSQSKNGKYSCVLNFLNKCCSPMGKRLFQYQLLNPNFDEKWLSNEYKMIGEFMSENYFLIDIFRKQLTSIRDIEKISRQIVIKKIYPSSIAYLYKSIDNIKQINNCLFELPTICQYLCNNFENFYKNDKNYINNICNELNDFLDKTLVIDLCKCNSSMNNFDGNIIQPGISNQLDEIVSKYNENQDNFNKIRLFFNQLIQTSEKSPDTEYIKIHETEKSGSCLQITAKRSLLLKKIIENLNKNPIYIDETLQINSKDIKFIKASSSNMEISFKELDDICKNILYYKEQMNIYITQAFFEFLDNFEQQFYNHLENLASFVSKIDVLQSKVFIAKNYNYCCPIIENSEKSFVDAKELRHCLIEHIQQNEIYVTNDICLGKNNKETDEQIMDGILLYGTNAVGKTSLIRALGVAIIMAQSGMYVPCSKFVFKPYNAIFSRILGNDNLFKGLSTFAVEMTELRIILKMADENSLILGDELCSGTETESALSIFTAGLIMLNKKKCSYIFATHFHEIIEYDEIRELSNLALKHMSVLYDRENDCLVYDRKLKDGSGPRIYGLEVCKSLYLDNDFLDLAYDIRNKHFPETRGELSSPTTIYNSNKIRGLCEVCGETIGEETHHLSPQKDADVNGFIGTFHKNHKANLASICEKCHDKIHLNNEKLIRKKTTKGFILKK